MKRNTRDRRISRRQPKAVPQLVTKPEVLTNEVRPAAYGAARLAVRLATLPRAGGIPIPTIAEDAIALEIAAREIRAGQIDAKARARGILSAYGADLVTVSQPGLWMGTAARGFTDRYLIA